MIVENIPKDFYFFRDESLVDRLMTVERKVIKRFKSFILGKCSCNCGEDIPIRNTKKLLQRYKNHHNRNVYKKGEKHHLWNNGIRKHGDYYSVLKPEHHQCDKMGYVKLHRLVYEEYYNCCLLPWVEIHHKKPVKEGGQDIIENLQPVTKSQHLSISKKKDLSDRSCLNCNSNETYKQKNGTFMWHIYPNGVLCEKCHKKLIYKERKNKGVTTN